MIENIVKFLYCILGRLHQE